MKTCRMDMTSGLHMDEIRRAGEILKNGGLVAFPTETVYGLGGNALDPAASKRIYAAKGRPSDNPLIVHIARLQSLERVARVIPETAKKLAAAFWPGPLTMILEKQPEVPFETTGGLDTVAVRMPDHPAALALIEAGGGFVAAPSANLSGRPSPTSAAHVLRDLDGRIDAVIDGGNGRIGLESTIVDLTVCPPVILRPGYITQDMLASVIGPVGVDPALLKDDPALRPKAPGMKYRHYAPKGDMKIVEGSREAVVKKMVSLTEAGLLRGQRVGIIASEENLAFYRDMTEASGGNIVLRCAGARDDEEAVARSLYAILREFDEKDVSVIYSESFEAPGLGQAVMNRLIKAAGHQILLADEA